MLVGQEAVTFSDLVLLSLSTIVPLNVAGPVSVSSAVVFMILTIEAFCGIIIAGLFASLLLRWVLNR